MKRSIKQSAAKTLVVDVSANWQNIQRNFIRAKVKIFIKMWAEPCEEGAVDVAEVVIDRSASAVPSRKVDWRLSQEGDVGLCPGVLVTADHDARVIAPEEKQMLKM